MANDAVLVVRGPRPHQVEIGYSNWRHRIVVRVDGRPWGPALTWRAPAGAWTLTLPGDGVEPLRLSIECRSERLHYPHAHVLRAECGSERLRLASPGY